METSCSYDLGLLPPLEDVDNVESESLLGLLTFDGTNLENAEFLQGPVLPLDEPCSLDQFESDVKSEPIDADAAGPHGESESADAAAAAGTGGKRRRRVRNSKQQELNRLAQQRYRQRKKEKYSELQVAVNSLQEKCEQLTLLEKECAGLRSDKVKLQEQLQQRDTALAQATSALRSQAAALKTTQERCAVLEKQVADQQVALEQRPARSASSSLLPAGVDPQALSDRLLAVLKAALADVSQQHGAAAAPLVSDVVMASVSRTLTSCCRELVYSSPSSLSKAAAAEAPAAMVPVSCC